MEKDKKMSPRQAILSIGLALFVCFSSSLTFVYNPIREVNQRYKALEKADRLNESIKKLADYRYALRLDEIELEREYYRLTKEKANRELTKEIAEKQYTLRKKIIELDSLLTIRQIGFGITGRLRVNEFDKEEEEEVLALFNDYEQYLAEKEEKR